MKIWSELRTTLSDESEPYCYTDTARAVVIRYFNEVRDVLSERCASGVTARGI